MGMIGVKPTRSVVQVQWLEGYPEALETVPDWGAGMETESALFLSFSRDGQDSHNPIAV